MHMHATFLREEHSRSSSDTQARAGQKGRPGSSSPGDVLLVTITLLHTTTLTSRNGERGKVR